MTQPETSQSYNGNQIVQTTIIFRTEEPYYTFVPTTYIYTSLQLWIQRNQPKTCRTLQQKQKIKTDRKSKRK
jgi:hypothetical protein